MKKFIKQNPVPLMIIGLVLIGSTSTMMKLASEEIPIIISASFRYLGTGFVLLPLLFRDKIKLRPYQIRQLLLLILMGSVAAFGWIIGLDNTTALNASLLFLLTPVFVYIGSVVFLGEPAKNTALIGAIVSLIGGLILVGEPVLSNSKELSSSVFGNALLMAGSVSTAATVVYTKRLYSAFKPLTLIGLRSSVVGAIMLLYAILNSDINGFVGLSLGSWLALAFIILATGVIGSTLYYSTLLYMRAEDSASLMYVEMLSGVTIAALLLNEAISQVGIAAIAVMVFGILLAHPHHGHRMHFYLHYDATFWQKIKKRVDRLVHH